MFANGSAHANMDTYDNHHQITVYKRSTLEQMQIAGKNGKRPPGNVDYIDTVDTFQKLLVLKLYRSSGTS